MITSGLFKSNYHEILRGILLVICVGTGGYLIEDFPPKFLGLFKHIPAQFVIFLFINYASRRKFRVSEIKWIVAEAIISVIILQLFKLVAFTLYPSEKQTRKH